MSEIGFKAEVQQLLELMIHSVYSDREVFLRELVSNSADALDKVRFLELTRPELRPGAADGSAIRVRVDETARIVTIEDDGIGMTAAEAVENLGTIAKSGTKAFVESARSASGGGGAPNLIGQFGLGFYASFMVADKVEVDSLSAEPGSEPVLWSSSGKGVFEVAVGTRATRGTTVTLWIREDAVEFASARRLQTIVRKHSNFLSFPVYVGDEKANAGKALWAEPPGQVSESDAADFYRQIAMDWRDPALRVHVSVDSPLQYRALLFIPSQRPYDLYTPEAPRGPRLYARRVLIEEHARELLPDWLRFVRGAVDSDDIPLNVSREMVQKTAIVRKLKDTLAKRVLKELDKHAAAPREGEGAPKVPYSDVWAAFGVLLKEGYWHQKDDFGELLLPLLRFNTMLCADATTYKSLSELVAARPEGQEHLWYLSAESRDAALASPHLEAFRKRGWDVMLLTDPVDEWLTQVLTEFNGVALKSASRGELDLPVDDVAAVAELGDFGPWAKSVLGDAVSEVRPSARLTDSAVVLVDAEDGLSSNMERILRQANQDVSAGKRILELNTNHQLVRNLKDLHSQGKIEDASVLMRMLLDEALLLEGSVKDSQQLGRRLQDLLVRASEAALRA